jgi:hypothetical protein
MEAGQHAPEVHEQGNFWLEIAIAVVLGLTAVTTAYAAYQAGKNERSTVAHYNEGIRDSSLSTGVLLEAEQTLSSDRALFLQYVSAAQTNEDLARYYLRHLMSPNLKAGVVWSARQDKYPTPFVAADPHYNDKDFTLGNALSDRSDKLFATAKKTHKTSNDYGLVTVIAAVALFLLGVAGVTRHLGIRLAFFVMGTAFFAASLVLVLTLAI